MLLASDQRGIVVFKLLPSLPYGMRMALAFALVLVGFGLQFMLHAFWIGGALILVGNLFVLVNGYDNRVTLDAFDASAEWQRVERDRLVELQALDEKILRWDRSSLDISNILGFLVFLVVAGALGLGVFLYEGMVRVLCIDGLLLLVPHWITGTRSILTLPGLLIRTNFLLELTDAGSLGLREYNLHYLMLLTGAETKIPDDVKIKVGIEGQHPDFLGLYGQVVTNDVQGRSYPYFYVVLVAKRGYGLHRQRVRTPPHLVIEDASTDEVDVMVIRQFTTKKSGYHTELERALEILSIGLHTTAKVATGPVK